MPDLLSNIFNIMKDAQPIGMDGAASIRFLTNTPLIVTADKLDDLLSRSDCIIETLGKPYKVVRFLLRKDRELVFAAEGTPSRHIPAHYQMASSRPFTAECISAGNAFFDEDNKLCIINHKSGDFRPSFDSLQFALEAFARSNVPMKENITVKRLNRSGADEQDYSICAADIRKPTLENPSENEHVPVSCELPVAAAQNINYQDKLLACGLVGATIAQQIKRLEEGSISCNPYWVNSSQKLNAIIIALETLPSDITQEELENIVKSPCSELYKALNIHRLSPITFFGRLGCNNAKSLQAVHEILTTKPII